MVLGRSGKASFHRSADSGISPGYLAFSAISWTGIQTRGGGSNSRESQLVFTTHSSCPAGSMSSFVDVAHLLCVFIDLSEKVFVLVSFGQRMNQMFAGTSGCVAVTSAHFFDNEGQITSANRR